MRLSHEARDGQPYGQKLPKSFSIIYDRKLGALQTENLRRRFDVVVCVRSITLLGALPQQIRETISDESRRKNT